MIRTILCFSILFIFCINSFTQTTTIQGIVKDSLSGEPISFVTIRFDDSTVGGFSEDDGKYKLSNRQNKTTVIFSLMGYNSKRITIPEGKVTSMNILLSPEGVHLKEIVIRPKKEKYSKKNNPAVELAKKVIANKHNYTIANQSYYKSDEYDRIFFALNEFNVEQPQYKKLKFLENYSTTSKIDDKKILPFSVRETLSDVYYRQNPNAIRRIVKAHKIEGVDQGMDTETLDAIISETFKTISITDNNINLLFHDFVGPLNTNMAIDFYKWYIIDTVKIEDKPYINLGFVPFNSRDVGFSGSLFISTDSTYAIKRVSMRVPTKININFVDDMIVNQEFEQISPTLWIPKEFTTAIDVSLYQTLKFYIEKVKSFDNFTFNQPIDVIFENPAPEIYLSDYNKQDEGYWKENRPPSFNDDYMMKAMIDELMSNKFINILIKTANILSAQYIATSKHEDKNKLDLGTTLTFYSHNELEGHRFRLTAATNKNFHKNLYLYSYLAYGTKDKKFKYMGEVAWTFNRRDYHKDEYPKNNLSLSHKYDVNALGQYFLQAERDNALMSFSTSKNTKLTYDRVTHLDYIKEYYSGFSFNLFGKTNDMKPAHNLTFEHLGSNNMLDTINNIKTSEVGLVLRYAHNEKFFQQRRRRKNLPSKGFTYTLSFNAGVKDFLDGDYSYQKLSFAVNKQFWIAPLGRIYTNVQADKIWGEVPYPLLLSANANNSITIQRGSFYLLEPLEFINEQQVTWDITWRMGGWLFNRVPIIKTFKWREIIGFRGFIGSLSEKNNPAFNKDLIMFPKDSYSMGNTPYMEYTVGIENIFQFFRIDYVRRLNYLDNPNISKSGFRIGFDVTF